MSAPGPACEACLRRSALVAGLAPLIERSATGEPGSRTRELLALDDDALARALSGRGAERALERARAEAPSPRWLRERTGTIGVWSLCRHDGAYPERLRDLGAQAPAALFGRGDPGLLALADREPGATVVGTRRASEYGKSVARALGRLLAAADVLVVSGLANGIDAAAHAGAIDEGAPTVAVLAAGPERAYPPAQRRLHRRIVRDGLVLSELPPGSRPYRWTFPARNRIMAALGAITVVVEAASRSGSLITAEMALDLGRELGAVPGPVNTWRHEGANSLLADGARPIRGAQDVLDALYGPGAVSVAETGPPLDRRTASILAQIEGGAASCDAVAAALGAPASAVGAGLSRLELLGYVEADAGGRYRRTGLRAP